MMGYTRQFGADKAEEYKFYDESDNKEWLLKASLGGLIQSKLR